MNKKLFIPAEVEVINVKMTDIIATSCTLDFCGENECGDESFSKQGDTDFEF